MSKAKQSKKRHAPIDLIVPVVVVQIIWCTHSGAPALQWLVYRNQSRISVQHYCVSSKISALPPWWAKGVPFAQCTHSFQHRCFLYALYKLYIHIYSTLNSRTHILEQQMSLRHYFNDPASMRASMNTQIHIYICTLYGVGVQITLSV